MADFNGNIPGRPRMNGQIVGDLIFGVPGKSAYQLAVENGYEGSLEQWLDSLHGGGSDEVYIAVTTALAQAKASGDFDGQPGKDGEDGYTPVKGTDYYTEADKTEMVSAVLSALPTWTGGSY